MITIPKKETSRESNVDRSECAISRADSVENNKPQRVGVSTNQILGNNDRRSRQVLGGN